jgi:hypothetical protein
MFLYDCWIAMRLSMFFVSIRVTSFVMKSLAADTIAEAGT